MSYLANNMVKVASRYGFTGDVHEGDDVVTFTSDDKALRIVARYEIEAVLSVMVNGQSFDLEDGASNFSEHAIEMAVERLVKGREIVEACVAALNESGWSVEVVKTDYSNDYVRITKGSKKAYMHPRSGSSVTINGDNRRTAAKDLHDVGFLSSHRQIPGYSGVYPIAK